MKRIKQFFLLVFFILLQTISIAEVKNACFSEEEERFIKECVGKLNQQILHNNELLKEGKTDELQFAIDIRGKEEREILGPISNLDNINKKLNDFYTGTLKNQFKIPCYVLFSNRLETSNNSLLKLMNNLYEKNKIDNTTYSKYFDLISNDPSISEKIGNIGNDGLPSDNPLLNDKVQNLKITEEILSRSLLGGKDYLGVLLHYDFVIKGNEFVFYTNYALDKDIPVTDKWDLASKLRPTTKAPMAQWLPVYEDEVNILTAKLFREYDNTHKLYVNIAYDIFTKQHSLNSSIKSFNPFSIDETKVVCNGNDFDWSTTYVLSNNINKDIPGIENEETYKFIDRKLGFYAYNTGKHFYILHIDIESKDADKIDVSSFATDVLNKHTGSKDNLIFLVVLSYDERAGLGEAKKSIKYSYAIGNSIRQNIFAGFESTAKGGATLLTPYLQSVTNKYSYFVKSVLISFSMLPKPFIKYNIAVNPYCEVIRTINVAKDVIGLVDMRELVIISNVPEQPFNLSFSPSASYASFKYLNHNLVDEYIDQYHLYEAVKMINLETSCSKNLDLVQTYKVMVKNSPPAEAYGLERDYGQLAIDLASATALLLPTPYQVVAGTVSVVYYISKGNTTNAGLELTGIGLTLLTRQNVGLFLGKMPWKNIAKGNTPTRLYTELITDEELITFVKDLDVIGVKNKVVGDEVHLIVTSGKVEKTVGKISDNTLIVNEAGWVNNEIESYYSSAIKLGQKSKALSESGENLAGFVQFYNNGFLKPLKYVSKKGTVVFRNGKPFLQTVDIIPVDMSKDGRVIMAAKDLKFMQNSINNTGKLSENEVYYAIKNAYDLTQNTLSKEVLGPVRIWKNLDGTYWTLDHRRLASYKLAGYKDIAVKWVTQSEVMDDAYKMTTNTNGEGMFVKVYIENNKFVPPSIDVVPVNWDLIPQLDGSLKISINGKITSLDEIAKKYITK